jgi:hypothetical protein
MLAMEYSLLLYVTFFRDDYSAGSDVVINAVDLKVVGGGSDAKQGGEEKEE